MQQFWVYLLQALKQSRANLKNWDQAFIVIIEQGLVAGEQTDE